MVFFLLVLLLYFQQPCVGFQLRAGNCGSIYNRSKNHQYRSFLVERSNISARHVALLASGNDDLESAPPVLDASESNTDANVAAAFNQQQDESRIDQVVDQGDSITTDGGEISQAAKVLAGLVFSFALLYFELKDFGLI